MRFWYFSSLFFVFAAHDAFATAKNKSMIYVAVDKSKLIAELRTWTEDVYRPEVLSRFPIAIGKEKGDKEKAGDNKTPEGIYFTQSHIDSGKIPQEKYGPKAVPLDFPNPFDLFQNKTGYGIWLHGAGNDERIAEANVTEGCVAFYNKDIKSLVNWLMPYQAAVVISKDLTSVNREQDVNSLKARAEFWSNAWLKKDIDSYIGMYHNQFENNGKSKSEYKTYKNSLFSRYVDMDVKLVDMRILTHEKYAITAMNQFFKGNDSYSSNGRKVLYWVRDTDNEWRILREVFSERRLEPMVWTPRDLKQLSSDLSKGAGNMGEQVGPKGAITKNL